MSYNQSRPDRSETHYRRTGRSTGNHQQQQQQHRSSSAAYGKGAGAATAPAPSSYVDSSNRRYYSIKFDFWFNLRGFEDCFLWSHYLYMKSLSNFDAFNGIYGSFKKPSNAQGGQSRVNLPPVNHSVSHPNHHNGPNAQSRSQGVIFINAES